MRKIKYLPQNIIAKIAAGEVIERPAYVVKELVENAIDAEANYISIQIGNAGLKKISVTDNGEGMSSDDLKICFQPHTTSKLTEESELIGIRSLGFRGEALSSIAAISSMVIKSRTKNSSSGIQVKIQSGKQLDIYPAGMPIGTEVIVEQVFGNVPARKKFLKSMRTEFRHIIDIVLRYAIAYPNIRFLLSHNKRMVFDFSFSKDLLSRLAMLFGQDTIEQLLPVKYEDSYIKIAGFISRPQITTQNSAKHLLFINNRYVTDKLISLAVKEAYGNLLSLTKDPVYVLFLNLPYETVDVNVHPRKEQVSFTDQNMIYKFILKAVSNTLSENNLTFQNISLNNVLTLRENESSINSFAGKILKEKVLPWHIKKEILNPDEIIQLHNLYLVTQTNDSLLLVDQHAAHERILFEQFKEEFENQKDKKEIFHLPETISFEISISEAEILKEYSRLFFSLGFSLENFKGTTFTLRTIPLIFKGRNIKGLIQELIEDLSQEKKIKSMDKQTHKMIAYLACRAGIKAGDRLSKDEAKRLILQLEKTKNNFTCPHGRPTKIKITKNQLARMFKRN